QLCLLRHLYNAGRVKVICNLCIGDTPFTLVSVQPSRLYSRSHSLQIERAAHSSSQQVWHIWEQSPHSRRDSRAKVDLKFANISNFCSDPCSRIQLARYGDKLRHSSSIIFKRQQQTQPTRDNVKLRRKGSRHVSTEVVIFGYI